MNILYLCDEYPPGRHGGIGTMVQSVAREMVLQGHKVVVAGFYDWGYGGQDSFEDEGVKVYRFRRGLSSARFIKQDSLPVRAVYKLFKMSGIWQKDIERSLPGYKAFIEELIREHHIDLIEMPDYNDYMRFCNSYVPFPKLSKPVVVKMHGCMTYIMKENKQEVPRHIWQMEHDVLEQATALCSVSQYNAAKTVEYLECKKEVTVLYNGIHIPNVPVVEKERGTVIFTGTMNENKGIYQLMKAWNLVNATIPGAKLVICGKGPVEKVSALLTPSAKKTVHFPGHIGKSDLYEALAKANVAIFPSYAESFALAPMEAMACGTAVIYTRRCSGPELINEDIDGLLTEPDDINDMSRKIIYLLKDATACAEMAKQGQVKITARYDIKALIKRYIEYYNHLYR